MAELAKSRTRSLVKIGAWISVPGTYFDSEKATDIEKYYGKIVFISYDAVRVDWEDGYSSRVDLDIITLEPEYKPVQINVKTEKGSKGKGLKLLASALKNIGASSSTPVSSNVDFAQDLTGEEEPELSEVEYEEAPTKKKKVEPKAKRKGKGTRKQLVLNPAKSDDDEILDYSTDEASEDEENVAHKQATNTTNTTNLNWKEGGWKVDPRKTNGSLSSYGPRLTLPLYVERSELDYFLHFSSTRIHGDCFNTSNK